MRESGKGCGNGKDGGRFFGAGRVRDDPDEGTGRPQRAREGA